MRISVATVLAAAAWSAIVGGASASAQVTVSTAETYTCAITGGAATAPPMPLGPGTGYWDLWGSANCSSGSNLFGAQVLVTNGFYSTLLCGTGTGNGTMTLRYPTPITGTVDTRSFPMVVPITVAWVGLQQTVVGTGGTHGSNSGGTVAGEDSWIPIDGCAPATGHFEVAGTLVFAT